MWVAPTSALIVAYLLYDAAGYAGLIGIAPVFLVVPLQSNPETPPYKKLNQKFQVTPENYQRSTAKRQHKKQMRGLDLWMKLFQEFK